MRRSPPSRRDFLRQSLGCAGWLAAAATLGPTAVRRAFAAQARGRVVAESQFARIEALGRGVWAVVSTPLRDGGGHFTTTANGGIIQGSDGVLLVEAFRTDEGARWVHEQARALTGTGADRVVMTHFHGDHCRGLPGLTTPAGAPASLATPTTTALLRDGDSPARPDTTVDETVPVEIDLGGRVVRLAAHRGHTPSDLTIEIEEPAVLWCGDLVWNRMFPNFVDAIPSHQVRACERLLARSQRTCVPGHGDVAEAGDLAPYLALLQDLETAGRRAAERGVEAAAAAAVYRIPESLGEWTMFSTDYIARAFAAWERELSGA